MKERIKSILIEEFVSVESVDELRDDQPLISSGILDSISILQLVDNLEKEFKVDFQPHEIDRDYFDSVDKISDLIASKKG